MLNDEAELVIEQQNSFLVSEAMLLQAAAASVMLKEGGEYFADLIRKVSE